MTKQEFLSELRSGLSGLPQDDIEERIAFYSELADDRMEEGLPEEEAISGFGPLDEVIAQITSEIPLTRLVKERVKPKRALRVWEIVLLVLGSPIWLSLLIALFAVMVSVYVAVWSVVISFYAAALSLAVCGLAGLLGSVLFLRAGSPAGAGCSAGAGLVCAGLSIPLFFGCVQLTRGVLKLTRKLLFSVRARFIGKGDAK